jgi:pyridoxamine 5'-phosphate oxidase
MLEDWLQPLRAAIAQDFPDQPCPVAFATTHADGTPRVRMLICRRLEDDGTTLYVSDQRSEKNQHLKKLNAAEVVFWFPKTREQFRINGLVEVIDADQTNPLRDQIWRDLSDATRATFFWPTPGAPREPTEKFERAASADVPIPTQLSILRLQPIHVERLRLDPFPHDRRRWTSAENWKETPLNP